MYTNLNSLSPANNPEEYQLHMAAWEWSIIEPIIIRCEEDIRSKNWKEHGLKPFKHQVQNLIYFCRKLPCTLIADDVGLGKTVSAALILSELMYRNRVQRTLIVAPKILCSQWKGELLNLFGLQSEIAESGKTFRELINKKSIHIIITTYAILREHMTYITHEHFQMGIFDEAHKLRNLYGTPKPPKIATVIQNAFQEQIFQFILMLTATPVQNRIWDIYSLIDLLKKIEGESNPFGNKHYFRNNFLEDSKGITLQENQKEIFRQILQKSICRTRRKDTNLPFPERQVINEEFSLEKNEKRLYEILKALVSECHLSALHQLSLARGLMSSPQAFLQELEKCSKDHFILRPWLSEVEDLIDRTQVSQKMQKVAQMIERIRMEAETEGRSWRAIVFTMRTVTQRQIARYFEELGFSYGFIRGGDPSGNQETIRRYKMDPPEVNIIISTDAGAEGVNLQEGNIIINYDLPWNPMTIEQRIGRVQRLGSSFEKVLVFNPYAKSTVEELVVKRLILKLFGISQAIGDIESILDVGSKEDDGSETYEKKIEQLVIASLQGQDIEKNAQKIEQDIQEAARFYEAHRAEIDQTISATQWDEELSEENLPPAIQPQFHSMTAQEFLEKAYALDRSISSWEKTWRRPYDISENDWNDPDKLHNLRVFTEQMNYWRKNASSLVFDIQETDTSNFIEIVSAVWYELFPDTQITSIEKKGASKVDFQGEILFRAEVSNSVNRFQKVLSSRIETLEGITADYSQPTTEVPTGFRKEINRHSDISQMISRPDLYTENAVMKDKELQEFADYYEKVLETKQSKVFDFALRLRNEQNFKPNFTAEVCGLRGFTYQIYRLNIQFQADSHLYSCLVNWIPLTRSFRPIAADQCEVTKITCPRSALEICEYTQKNVLRHLLAKLPDHRMVLESETAICGICHQRGLKCEMAISPVNHVLEHIAHKIKCEFSGQMGFPEEMEISDFSGRTVFAKFIQVSEKSGRKGVVDEFKTCTKTGRSLLNDEVLQRESDQNWYDKDLFRQSFISKKWELEEVMTRCELTDVWILPEESRFCCISQKNIRMDLAAESPFSHRFFQRKLGILSKNKILLPPEEVCPVCKMPILSEEPQFFHPEMERMVHEEHFVESCMTQRMLLRETAYRSDVSGLYAEPEYFFQSDLSGKYGLESEKKVSEKSGRLGLSDEIKVCTKSGKQLLQDEVCQAASDNCWYDMELCQCSVLSKTFDLEEKMVQCEKTQVWLFPEERLKCCISGKMIRKDQMLQSSISKRFFCREFGLESKDMGLLPPEEVCPVCGNAIREDEKTVRNPSTQRRNHRSHFEISAVTGRIHLRDEMQCSEMSGLYAEPKYFETSVSGRIGLKTEMCTCGRTGQKLLRDETVYSQHHRSWFKKEICEQSEISLDWGPADECLRCEFSGKKMFLHESALCVVTGKRVAKNVLRVSALSGKKFIPTEGIKTVTNQFVLKNEAAVCLWQNGYILKNEVATCQISNRTFHKKFIRNKEFYILNDLNTAIENSIAMILSWQQLSDINLIYLIKSKGWKPGFYARAPECQVYVYWNSKKTCFVFCAQNTETKMLFFKNYTYYFGLACLRNGEPHLLHPPILKQSSFNIWS